MTLTNKQLSILSHTLLALFIFVCFRAGIDNFFSSDDYDWLFLALKAKHHPSYFITSQGFFLRYTEAAYFIVNFLVAGFQPVAYQFTAICIHVFNVVLLSYLISLLCKNRLSGILGALFWGVNYKHVEAVFRVYGVADSLAMLFGLGAFLLFLHKRPILAAISLFIGIFGKENAVLFPLIMSTYVMLCMSSKRITWLKRTIPLWAVAGFAGILGWYVRSKTPSYLTIDWQGLVRFWELLLTYIGPDATYLKQVWLSGAPLLIPFWLAVLLLPLLAILFWKLPNIYRFGIAWMIIMTLPTVFVGFQTSRYYYIPLAGLGLIVGHGTSSLLTRFREKHSQRALALTGSVFTLIIIYYIVGVNLEEQDYDYFGEIHRQAAESFKTHVLPTMPKDAGVMTVFPKEPNQAWAENLYDKFLSKPWYAPFTFKWVYTRPYEILGLTNTYCFVSTCAYTGEEDTLFVKVPYDEYRKRLLNGNIYIVTYDQATNTFGVGEKSLHTQWLQHIENNNLYNLLQPGYFDSTNQGTPYF